MRLYGLLERLTKLKLFNAKEVSIEPATQAGSSDKVINIPAIPDADTPQEMVLSKQSQTLEKKTLTSPNLNGSAAATVPADELNLSTAARTLKIKDQSTNVASISTASLTADRTFTLPDVTGTIVTTGDTGSITSAMIANGTIKDEDISSAPADKIAGSKITSTFGAQLLRTDQKLEVYASSPNEAVLINQTGIGNALVVEDATNPDTTATVIDNAGNVGIGVAATDNLSLNGKLTVAGNVKVTSGDINLDTAKGIESHTAGATLNVGTSTNTSVLNLGTGSSTQTVNIGTGAGVTQINIGATGDTVVVAGTLTTVNTTNLDVADKNVTLNKGGLPGTANGSGINIEAGGSTVASISYDQTDGGAQPQNTFTLNSTGAVTIPVGTTGQRPNTPAKGMIRYNDSDDVFEGYNELSGWSSIGGGGASERVSQTGLGVTVNFPVGTPLYVDASLGWQKAQADTAAKAEVAGILGKRIDDNTVEVILAGEVVGVATSLFENPASLPTKGESVFLSPTTAGKLTITEPTVVGQISKPIGIVHSVNAGVSVDIMFFNMRGTVVGGANVRTQIGLSNNATTTVQNASGYDAGSLSGWVYIDATTDLRFYVQAQFAKKGAAVTDYDLSYQTTGDTPPAGFSLTITNAGLIQAVMPSIAGFSSANINFALNAPAVGATLPLQIASTSVSFTDIQAASSAGITFKEDGGTPTMTITDAGNVGIGTASPVYRLHLQAGSGVNSYIGMAGNNNNLVTTGLAVGQDTTGLSRIYQFGANPITFWTNDTERMRIDAAGSLKIAPNNINGATTKGFSLRSISTDGGTNSANTYCTTRYGAGKFVVLAAFDPSGNSVAATTAVGAGSTFIVLVTDAASNY